MADAVHRVTTGLRVEEIGDELVVFDRDSGASIHRVRGDAAEALRLILDRRDSGSDLPGHLHSAVDDLIRSGIVEEPPQWSRRSALVTGGKALAVGGAAWGAATVTTFALADPAAAQTSCTSPGPTNPQQQKYTANAAFITDRGVTTLKVRCWGGGGGGGGGRYDGTWSSGSGGGGGAYAYTLSLTVTPCTLYSVVVGAQVNGGGPSTSGTDGNDSYFGSDSTVMAKGGAKGTGANGGNPTGGSGGQATSSVGVTTKKSGGNGGQGGQNVFQNTGGGGGGCGSDGSDGTNGGNYNGNGGNGGTAGSAQAGGKGGGDSGNGVAPGGGGGGGHGDTGGSTSGGKGARGEVWVGY